MATKCVRVLVKQHNSLYETWCMGRWSHEYEYART